MQRVRVRIVKEFLRTHPWLAEKHVVNSSSTKHPVCVHAFLLRSFVADMFHRGEAFVADDDVRWIESRAVPLPESPDATEAPDLPADVDAGIPVDSVHLMDNDAKHCGESNSGVDNGVPKRQREMEWWTVVDTRDQSPFQCSAPWSEDALRRLIRFDLPLGVILTLDPQTGFVRATDIANAFNKRVAEWLSLGASSLNNDKGTRGVAHALASKIGKDVKDLVYVVNGGSQPGTWIHVRLVFNHASWCNTAFAVHTDDIALRYYR